MSVVAARWQPPHALFQQNDALLQHGEVRWLLLAVALESRAHFGGGVVLRYEVGRSGWNCPHGRRVVVRLALAPPHALHRAYRGELLGQLRLPAEGNPGKCQLFLKAV